MIIIKKIIKKIPLSQKTKQYLKRIIKPSLLYFISNKNNPISNYYGLDRGKPIDRLYIESFLEEYKDDIRGVCLELLDNKYTLKYGEKKVIQSDILDIEENNKNANMIGDLRQLNNISDNAYDCIILTQVLQFIDNLDSAISECYRILKKDGVILVTLPSLSRIDCVAKEDGDFWRFTKAGAEYLFSKKFSRDKILIQSKGNVRAGLYFYAGFSQEDAPNKIFKKDDINFPLIITLRAKK